MWHMTYDRWGEWSVLKILRKRMTGWIHQSINYEDVFRTSQATPRLLPSSPVCSRPSIMGWSEILKHSFRCGWTQRKCDKNLIITLKKRIYKNITSTSSVRPQKPFCYPKCDPKTHNLNYSFKETVGTSKTYFRESGGLELTCF